MASPIPEEIKRNVRAVLLSKVGGVHLSMFIKDYKSLVLKHLDYRALGFETLQAFLKSIPEIARLEKSGSDIKVFGVGDPNTYLPVGAKKAQGKLPKDYHKNLQAAHTSDKDDSSASDMEQPTLEIDQYGWFSLCCPVEKAPSLDPKELECLFLQIGSPIRIHLSAKWLFVRYKSKEECLKALKVFGDDYDFRIASNQKTKPASAGADDTEKKGAQKYEKTSKGRGAGYLTDAEDKPKQQRAEKKTKNGFGHKNHQDKSKDSGYLTDAEVRSNHQRANNKLNGHVSKENSSKKQKKECNPKALFVHGISDEEAFRELIKPYKPVKLKLVPRQNWWIGFLEMATEEEAKTVIADLNHKEIGEKFIIVDYDTPKEYNSDNFKKDINQSSTSEKETQSLQNDSNRSSTSDKEDQPSKNFTNHMSTSGKESQASKKDINHNHTSTAEREGQVSPTKKKKPVQKSTVQSEFVDMPPLVEESPSTQNPNYYMDCVVYLGFFPPNTTFLALQETFAKYHVKDIIIGNISTSEGCTRAYLYLSSIADVIQCVEEMNGFNMDGHRLKVDVPYKNEKLRFALKRRLGLKTN